MRRPCTLVLLLLLFPLPTIAETAYVSEQLTTALRFAPGEGATPTKTLESGAPVEVLERSGAYSRVRDAQGSEGWIESRLLMPEPPSRLQVDKLKAELAALRGQLAQAQAQASQAQSQANQVVAQAKQAEAALAQQTAKTEELARALADAKTAPPPTPEPPPSPPVEMTPSAAGAPEHATNGDTDDDRGINLLWLGIAFAMLVVGFLSGVVWLRESIRRRSGGMYLKV